MESFYLINYFEVTISLKLKGNFNLIDYSAGYLLCLHKLRTLFLISLVACGNMVGEGNLQTRSEDGQGVWRPTM